MNPNETLITQFYTAFQQGDYKSMQDLYADEAIFNDEVFLNLNAEEVRGMWEMLISRSTDLQLEFKNVNGTEKGGSADWIATYTFSKTKRKVINRIHAEFVIRDGKIIRHTDQFNFHKWAKQALGFSGFLLGRSSFLRKKVQLTAQFTLGEFLNFKEA